MCRGRGCWGEREAMTNVWTARVSRCTVLERMTLLCRGPHSALRKMPAPPNRQHDCRAGALLAAARRFRHDCGNELRPPRMRPVRREALHETDIFRCSGIGAGVVGKRRPGADKTSAQTRRHPRHVRALCRHHRAGQRGRGEDGGGGFRRRGARAQDRDHRGRSSQQGRPCRPASRATCSTTRASKPSSMSRHRQRRSPPARSRKRATRS